MSTTKVTGMMQTSTKGGDISSASPTVIDTDGDYFDVTGTTNFAAFTVVAGRRFTVQFDGVLTMTHDATNLDLPGGANITTAAGDVAEFFATGTNTVQCVNYTKADGTAIVAGASGDLRNYILDGGMTQFPEGDKTGGGTAGTYGPALWSINDTSTAVWTLEQSTDIPTYAESGHQGKYSFKALITTADASLAVSDYSLLHYVVTGTDYADLHGGKNVTMRFWAKFDADGSSSTSAPYSFSVSIFNSALNRSYVKELSMAADDDWQKFEFTFPTDTTGTWLFTEADKGMRIGICMGAGSNYHGTDETWEGARDYSTSNQENLMDYAGNAFYLTQVGLYIGDSAPTFVGEPVSVIRQQVYYYVEPINMDQGGYLMNTAVLSTTNARGTLPFSVQKRTNDSSFLATGTPATDWRIRHQATITALSVVPALNAMDRYSASVACTVASGLTAGDSAVIHEAGADDNAPLILIDDRH